MSPARPEISSGSTRTPRSKQSSSPANLAQRRCAYWRSGGVAAIAVGSRTLGCLLAALSCMGIPARADLLWDNNLETDGVSGRPVSPPAFPNYRNVDDIVVPEGQEWHITGFNYQLLEDNDWLHGGWTEVYVWGDVGRRPGGERLFSQVVEHTRVATGNMYFGRFAYKFYAPGLSINLEPGRYWIGLRNPQASGSGTAYWLTSDGGPDGMGTESSWISLDAGQTWVPVGGGEQNAFEVHGTVVPEPVSLVSLGGLLAALTLRQRGRRSRTGGTPGVLRQIR